MLLCHGPAAVLLLLPLLPACLVRHSGVGLGLRVAGSPEVVWVSELQSIVAPRSDSMMCKIGPTPFYDHPVSCWLTAVVNHWTLLE